VNSLPSEASVVSESPSVARAGDKQEIKSYSKLQNTTRKYCSVDFRLKGYTLGFDPQTQKSESPCTA